MMGESDYEKDPEEELVEPDQPEEPEADAEPEAEAAGHEALAQALKGSFTVLKIGMIGLVIFYVLMGIFHVQPGEVRFKLRFGRIVKVGDTRALRPGTMHVRWPWEEMEILSTVEKMVELNKEFWTAWPVDPAQKRQTLKVRTDGYLITGDANIVHMRLRVRYRARDDADGALAHLFAVKDPEAILKRCLMASATKIIGSTDVMDVLKRQGPQERVGLLDAIALDLKARLKDFEQKTGVPLGLEVRTVEAIESEKLKNPREPSPVRQAFYDAQNAGSLYNRLKEEGRSDAISIVENAEAEADQIKAEARADRARLVEAARADARTLQELLPVYLQSRDQADILRDVFYQRALRRVLRGSGGIYVLYQAPEGVNREIRFLHGRKPFVAEEGGEDEGAQ